MVPATVPVLLATVLVLMVILEKAWETVAHCAVHGMLSPCRIMGRMSSTSWHGELGPFTLSLLGNMFLEMLTHSLLRERCCKRGLPVLLRMLSYCVTLSWPPTV